ncbi:FAD/NAD-linked reductase, partial [Baffinella frigidus]
VEYVKGYARMHDANTVEVEAADGTKSLIKTKNTIIASGSEPVELPFMKFNDFTDRTCVSSTGALLLDKVPKKMAVIGGGVIGLELGSVWARLGTEVTVIEFMDRLCPTMDTELITAFQRSLKKNLKFKFKLETKVSAADIRKDGVTLTLEGAGGKVEKFEADVALVAVGRRPRTEDLGLEKWLPTATRKVTYIPRTEDLGLEKVGVEVDKAKRIVTGENFKTKVPGIFAIGDAIAGPMLAHKELGIFAIDDAVAREHLAEEEGVACVEFIAGKHGHINYDVIPGVIYTHPEVASVGKTEEELKAAGVDYRKGTFPFMANSRARATGSAEGMVKMLVDAKTDKILGCHIMSNAAGEMIHEAVLAMEYGASAEDLGRTCHAHPTLSEAIKEAAMACYDKPIHF